MKISSLFLAVSLVLNAALIGVLGFRSAEHSGSAVPASPAAIKPEAVDGAVAVAAAPTSLANPATAARGAPKFWERCRDDDLTVVVRRLREAGFPPGIVRRIMTALIVERFDARRLAIEKDLLAAPFWSQTANAYSDPKTGPQLRALQREQLETMKRVLGSNLAGLIGDTPDEQALLRFQIGHIPPEKLDPLYNAVMDFMDKRANIAGAAAGGGTLLPADRKAMVALEKDMLVAAAKFLSPAEVEDFNLHMTPSSQELRSLLAPFQPTQEEFRTLLPLYQQYVEQFPGQAFNLPPEQAALRQATQDQLMNQARMTLPPARIADLEQVLNPHYTQLNRLVARLDLPLSAAKEVAAVQDDVQQRARALAMDTVQSRADRRSQMTALANEATTRISSALGGARGLEAYKMNGGQWLLNLQGPASAAGSRQ